MGFSVPFGEQFQMKVRQKSGHLRLGGLSGAETEWTLHPICHKLRKLANGKSECWVVDGLEPKEQDPHRDP